MPRTHSPIIADRHSSEALTSLKVLLRINQYIAQVTLPFIYRNPFCDERAYILFGKQGHRGMARTLLGNVLGDVTGLSEDVILEFKLDLSPSPSATNIDAMNASGLPRLRPLNYLGHLHCRNIHMRIFTGTSLESKTNFRWSRCLFNNRMDPDDVEEKKELAWYFWEAALYRNTLWALATPVLDQLEALESPLSDIFRWTRVVDRLARLETLRFCLDEVPFNNASIISVDGNGASEAYKVKATQALSHFVREHTQLFRGQLKTVNPSQRQMPSRYFDQPWHIDFQQQVYRPLPPIYRPTSLSKDNWVRLLTHPEITDLGYVKEISVKSGMWGLDLSVGGLEEYSGFL
ncbi:hypothetical protein BG015_009866 [Linnemannia schmuckeri]|uniref:Uncharacterized protein n=1 Tax=Linnemannia schmuckeri TaxID=64567 RepID=A0A9P5RYE0_9FUNG|nr:hypothetical protein BG015_009866 [Linnemannia schmuckeri]